MMHYMVGYDIGEIVSSPDKILFCALILKGRKVLYLDTLKQFGKKRGLEIYTKIREMI